VTADNGQQFFGLVGQLVAAGGGGALIAFVVFRFLGKNWIEHQFANRLEATKSEISILSARRLKLHDREYVVFPELWCRLNKVVNSLNQAVISFHMIPNLGRFTADELDSWLTSSDLSEDERSYFTSETDKTRAYSRILGLRDLNGAHKDFVAFHTYLQDNRIFLSPDIKDKLGEIDKSISGSLVAKKMDSGGYGVDSEKSYLLEAVEMLDKQVKPLMVEIELLVQARLFPESSNSKTAGKKK
jgi:hypothetical protein